LANPCPFLFREPNLETDAEQLLFRVWGCGRKTINTLWRHGRGWFHFIDQLFLPMGKRAHHWHHSLALDEDKVNKRPGKLVGWKALLGTEDGSPKAKGTMCTPVDDIPCLDLTIKYGRAGKCDRGKRGAFAVEVAAAFPYNCSGKSETLWCGRAWWSDCPWRKFPFYCSGSVNLQVSTVRIFPTPRFDMWKCKKSIHACEEMKSEEMEEAWRLWVILVCARKDL